MAIHDRPELRERAPVFFDREAAGPVVAEMLEALALKRPLILAIPSGGVPVGVAIARATHWPIDVAVVSKITLPWNTEAGYGAVAFDGSVRLNHDLIADVGLRQDEIEAGIAKTRAKVERRARRLRVGSRLELEGRTAILVDDGLASGTTMELAVEAVRKLGPVRVVAAVPTGHSRAVDRVGALADDVVCANVRAQVPFAVAEAYERWQDVPEVVADELLRPYREHDRPWATGPR